MSDQFFLFGVIFLLSLQLVYGQNSPLPSNNNPTPFVVNGKEAKPGQFPGMVSIRYKYNGKHLCGGSIITNQWMLTAAHCLVGRRSPYFYVMAGEYKLYPFESIKNLHNMSRVVIHRDFYKDISYDLALVKVHPPFRFDNKTLREYSITRRKVSTGEECQMAGWGETTERTSAGRFGKNESLMYADLTIVAVEKEDILAENNNKTAYPCYGDSGSGFICGGELVGVASRGLDLTFNCNHTVIYTSTYSNRRWIEKTIGSRLEWNLKTNGSKNQLEFLNSFVFMLFLLMTIIFELICQRFEVRRK